MTDGTYINGGEQFPTFIPAPEPPKNIYLDRREPPSLYERERWVSDIEKWEHQMEYYNSVIVPLGDNR